MVSLSLVQPGRLLGIHEGGGGRAEEEVRRENCSRSYCWSDDVVVQWTVISPEYRRLVTEQDRHST